MIAMRFAALCGTPRIAGVDTIFEWPANTSQQEKRF
jgi:hypothetical protein